MPLRALRHWGALQCELEAIDDEDFRTFQANPHLRFFFRELRPAEHVADYMQGLMAPELFGMAPIGGYRGQTVMLEFECADSPYVLLITNPSRTRIVQQRVPCNRLELLDLDPHTLGMLSATTDEEWEDHNDAYEAGLAFSPE